MTTLPTRLTCLALLALAPLAPSWAESSASSASSAASTSVGSASDSIRGSSNSSSRTTNQVAQGDYRVVQVVEMVEVAAIEQRAGRLRLTLQAVALPGAAGELILELPRQALAARGLAAQDVVSVRQRPYGLEFAYADARSNTREPFFLVLADEWHRELDARPVVL